MLALGKDGPAEPEIVLDAGFSEDCRLQEQNRDIGRDQCLDRQGEPWGLAFGNRLRRHSRETVLDKKVLRMR